ncbi:MAG: SDR family NAD(P)-dependent oxidoreductase [Treponema sp.]|jgi:sorbitol-6-phosphate 2-dehydrogenase|nr:SDR family NAD(P)-dependent oxidoreductase [Treponema sp.]
MNYISIAPMIRGLCIDLAGKPQIAVCEPAKEGKAPARAMSVEIAGGDTEETIAGIIQKAYAAWKTAPLHAAPSAGGVLIPSCVSLTSDGKPEALYWIDDDLDSARKRLAERNDSPVTAPPAADGRLIDAAARASVVKNRVALVTGGAQGIGEEIVRNLAAAGALVLIADLNLEGARKLAEAVNAEEKRTAALALQVNVSDEDSVEAMCNAASESAGGLDLCVSNAGVLKAGSVLEQGLADFKFVTDINYTGFFIITKFAGRLLKAQSRTAPRWKTDIIQINSKSGLEGSNKNGAYAGGKFGGIGLVASFALELVEYNIKVNAVCPGNFLDGPLWSDPEKGLFVQYLKTGKVPGAKNTAEVRAFYESKVPMKRGCTGKDLVRAIYYLVEQEYETGQAIPVTGGQVMLH